MDSNRYEREIRIPIRIVNQSIVQLDGSALPKFVEGALGDLFFSKYALSEKEDIEKYDKVDRRLILKSNSKVYFTLNQNYIPKELKESYFNNGNHNYVEVVIKDDLFLTERFNKKSRLNACNCSIPIINQDAISLNHAYTLISQFFETNRKSHTGNVFELCFTNIGDKFLPLDSLR